LGAKAAGGGRCRTGDIDAMWMVAGWEAPRVQQLLDDRVTISGYQRADALIALVK
jgi:TRAP-type uncharacterized transport system substrate-binding protein